MSYKPKNTNYNKNTKKVLKPTPKIYGFFKPTNPGDEDLYRDTGDILFNEIKGIYPSFVKSFKILDQQKNGELTGLFNLYLTEQAKDMTQEQFNHLVRIINKQAEILPYIKLFFVSTNEPASLKYTYNNFVKTTGDKPIPHIFFFCESNDISVASLKTQLSSVLTDKYMDLYAIKNKSKTDYNIGGGYFIKVRLTGEITPDQFVQASDTIRSYFNDNLQETNIKTYYKTETETNGKKYSLSYPFRV